MEGAMNWKRAKLWFSPARLTACRRLFDKPWRTHMALAFLTRQPVRVTLKNGRSMEFSRQGRDHLFWDWLLRNPHVEFDFTPDRELLLRTPTHTLLLRPATTDFFIYGEIFLDDCYHLQSLPSRVGTVIDLGGNVGLFACAMLPRAERVITVEAVEAYWERACTNVKLNGGDSGSVLRYAVTGETGKPVAIHLAQRHSGASSIFPGFIHCAKGQEIVPSISLADLLEQQRVGEVDLLKCDVEGAEFEIFRSTPPAVLRRIHRIVMEVHLNVDRDGAKERALAGKLREAGFVVTVKTPATSRAVSRVRMLKAHRP
jgi:FkbM family methyltransferase